jgi:Flp pilus assembly pilin Flp
VDTIYQTNRVWRRLCKLVSDKAGQDLIEYALLAALVAAMAVAVFPAIASTSTLYSRAMNALALALSSTAGN